MVQLYSWVANTNYSQAYNISYLPPGEETTYTIPMTQYLPTYELMVFDTEISEDEPISFNDRNVTRQTWTQYSVDSSGMQIESTYSSINCRDLIQSWTHLLESERNDLIDELPSQNNSMCPDVEHLMVQGGQFGKYSLELELEHIGADLETSNI